MSLDKYSDSETVFFMWGALYQALGKHRNWEENLALKIWQFEAVGARL